MNSLDGVEWNPDILGYYTISIIAEAIRGLNASLRSQK